MTRIQEARTAFDEYHDLVQALTDQIPDPLPVATLIGRLIDAKLSESAAGRREPAAVSAMYDELPRRLYEEFANEGDPGIPERRWDDLSARERTLLSEMCNRARDAGRKEEGEHLGGFITEAQAGHGRALRRAEKAEAELRAAKGRIIELEERIEEHRQNAMERSERD